MFQQQPDFSGRANPRERRTSSHPKRCPPTSRQRLARRAVISGIALICLGLIASWIVAGRLVAPRPKVIGDPPDDLPAETISFHSESGSTIAGWHVQADGSHGVVLLLHGIGGSRLSMLERARMLFAAGYSVVMIDLRAHGESSGEQVTIGHLERHDVRAAVKFARERHPGEPIGVIGVSLGGASALLASPLPIDALVVESVYPDIHRAIHNRVAAQLGPFSWVPAELLLMQLKPRLGVSREQLRPIDHLQVIGCPVLMISGADDHHTTAAETREMFAAAPQPKQLWLIEDAAHVDLCRTNHSEYEQRVPGFLHDSMNGLSRPRPAASTNPAVP